MVAAPARGRTRALSDVWAGLGLTPSEVEAYQVLSDAGSLTASQLAKETGQSRGRMYLVLRSLVERGFVREEVGEPHRFSGVTSHEILEMAARAARRRADELETIRAALPPSGEVAVTPDGARKARAYALHGRRAMSEEMLRILERSTQRFFVAGAGAITSRLAEWPAFIRALGARARQGVRVALACPEPGSSLSLADMFTEARPAHVTGLTAETAFPLTLVVGDSDALLVAVDPDNASPHRGEDFGIHLEGRAFADAVASWFERLALGHVPVGGNIIRHLVEARKELLDAIDGAQREVVVMGAGGWFHLLFGSGEEDRDARATRRKGADITFRLVAEADPAAWRVVRPLMPSWEARLVRSVPAWVLVVDDSIAFVGLPGGEKQEVAGVRKALDPAESRHYRAMFGRMWESGADLKS